MRFVRLILSLVLLFEVSSVWACRDLFSQADPLKLSQPMAALELQAQEDEANRVIGKLFEKKPVHTTPEFQIYELFPDVYFVEFESQREMTRTFVRFQEHYESPEFRKKVFTLTEYKQWYREAYDSRFKYFSENVGFNVQAWAFDAFFDGRFKNITARERALIEFFRQRQGRKFYVIAGVKPSKEASHEENEERKQIIRHEIAHAIYYQNGDYRKDVALLIKNRLPRERKKQLQDWLVDMGYHPEVIEDEAQASLSMFWRRMVKEGFPFEEIYPAARALIGRLNQELIFLELDSL